MKKKSENKDNFYKYRKCYMCGGKVEEKQIVHDNIKWGGGEKRQEPAMANVCIKCGDVTFSASEAKRLQELSREY